MKPVPRKMMLRFAGLGDDLFVNTIAYHYWLEAGKKVYVAGSHRVLFRGNPGAWIIPTSSQKIAHQLGRFLMALGVVESMTYMGYQNVAKEEGMKPMEAHILEVLSEKVGLKTAPKKPLIFLSEAEKRQFALPNGGKPWVAMHSTGVTEMTKNKNWYPERFLEVSQKIRGFCRVVQLGRVGDPDLEFDLDLRGKVNPRQAAAVLSSCSALICQVGYLMHAAAAVGTKAVVVYGGFEAPWESGYAENINLYTELPCSPCWLRGPCPYDKKCMDQISVDDVIEKIQNTLIPDFVPPSI
jgi:ADP-heptose:LPS heptosyltransferase